MKIVIPGGAGFVGRNLVRVLSMADYQMDEVVVIDISPGNLAYVKRYGVRTVNADLSLTGEWTHEFENADMVINLAAQLSSPNHEPFYRNNMLATKNIIDAMNKANVQRIIHFSSAAVISLWQDDYARTKAEGERLVRASGLDYCILQPSIMYGPTDETNIGFLIKFAKKLPVFPIPGHGKWPRHPLSIDDVCHLVVKFITNFPHNMVISVNGRETIFYKDMVQTVLKELGGFKFRVFFTRTSFYLSHELLPEDDGGRRITHNRRGRTRLKKQNTTAGTRQGDLFCTHLMRRKCDAKSALAGVPVTVLHGE